MKVVVALGGNAIVGKDESGSHEEMTAKVSTAAAEMMKILELGHQLVITHGNGPQVGNLALQQVGSRVPQMPLHVLDAMTQGEIGYLLQRELGGRLATAGSKRSVVTVVTQVVVDPEDPAFASPSKPIGPFYGSAEAERVGRATGFVFKKVIGGSRGYRRVVPSPEPVSVVEAEVITKLLSTGAIVVAGGGGGVPVVRGRDGRLSGVDAVVDKDLCAEKLAEGIRADVLLILTDVPRVRVDRGKKAEREVGSMSVTQAKRFAVAGNFPAGSMGPKVEACVRFVEWGGKPAIIARLDEAMEAIEGSEGTRVVPD